jgi:hypothetical protein
MNRAGERGREGCVERNAMNLDSPPEGVKMEKMGERTKKMKKLKRDDTTAKSIAISASKNCFTAAMKDFRSGRNECSKITDIGAKLRVLAE